MRYIALYVDDETRFYVLKDAGELAEHKEAHAHSHAKWDYYELGGKV